MVPQSPIGLISAEIGALCRILGHAKTHLVGHVKCHGITTFCHNKLFLNLPTDFWGLWGPQKDQTMNFTKNSYHPDIFGLLKDRLWGPQRPQT